MDRTLAAPSDGAPARTLPLLYLATAHLSLALAFFFAGLWPHAVAGFFYHAWLIGLVHLVTLGWISFSIVGTFYVVAPLALRTRMPVRRADYVAYGLAVVGLVGMVGHFWIQQYSGMAWSAGTIAAGLLYMTARIVGCVRHAAMPRAVTLHVVFACTNFWIAASMGLLIACDKVLHFLPGFVLSNVFAHAHLAALGWAAMMIVGVGYRMLPMWLPSKMPSGRSVYWSAALLEVGVLGLFVSLLAGSTWAAAFALTVVAGLLVAAAHVVWMLRHRMTRATGAARIDIGLLHAAWSGMSLLAAVAIGVALVFTPASPAMLHAAAAYGVLGLVGFLAQMVVAMEARLLPMVTWVWAYAASGYQTAPASPHAMRDRTLQVIVLAAWVVGVPALSAGMFLESARLVGVGAWSLFAGTMLTTLDSVFVVQHGFPGKRSPAVSAPADAAGGRHAPAAD